MCTKYIKKSQKISHCKTWQKIYFFLKFVDFDDDDEFRFNDTSTHEGHLHQNDISTWFVMERL